MKFLSVSCLISVLLLAGCFPVAIAPDLTNGEIINGKKFKKQLPDRQAYIFTDSKPADEFYYYLRAKYERQPDAVEDNVPVSINDEQFYVSFYETSKSTKTVNLINPLVNEVLERNNISGVLNEETVRYAGDTYYIVLMVSDEEFNDGLSENHTSYSKIYEYVEKLQAEYLATNNYNQLLMKDNF